jgi:hypothetical protein
LQQLREQSENLTLSKKNVKFKSEWLLKILLSVVFPVRETGVRHFGQVDREFGFDELRLEFPACFAPIGNSRRPNCQSSDEEFANHPKGHRRAAHFAGDPTETVNNKIPKLKFREKKKPFGRKKEGIFQK